MKEIRSLARGISRRAFFGRVGRIGAVAGAASLLGFPAAAVRLLTSATEALACDPSCGYPCFGYCVYVPPHQYGISTCDFETCDCSGWTCTCTISGNDTGGSFRAYGHGLYTPICACPAC